MKINKKLRFYLRGLGIGMAVTALILGISRLVFGNVREMTDAEVIERAKTLGMVSETQYSLSDAVGNSQNEAMQDKTVQNPTEDSVKGTASQEDADYLNSDKEGQKGEINEDTTGMAETNALKSEEEVKAENIGNESATAGSENNGNEAGSAGTDGFSEDPKENLLNSQEEIEAALSAEAAENLTPALTVEQSTIVIPKGSGSETAARVLAEAGIISSASEFDKYLEQNGYSRSIRAGSFTIPSGADYEMIAKIITGKK